jgi:hypothetical protein
MFKMGKRKFLIMGLPILLLLFTANHLEYHFRRQRVNQKARTQHQVVVRAEQGTTGHTTIGIDESSVSSEKDDIFLHFASLGTWAFDPKANTPCPDLIRKLSGRTAGCIGFMYPLEAGENIKVFCLLRSTQTCCYGPRPQFNQYLFIEMAQPVKFERLVPVMVTGKFVVDPQPTQGFIYRMEATAVRPATDEPPQMNPLQAARKANLPLFSFEILGAMEKNKDKIIPPALVKQDGTKVVMEGFIVDRSKETPPRLMVSNAWWDGAAKGTPPNLYNAVMVYLTDSRQTPPIWKQKTVFTGRIQITRNPADWPKTGIVSIQDAVMGVPGKNGSGVMVDIGPYLPMTDEVFVLTVFLIYTCWRGLVKGNINHAET